MGLSWKIVLLVIGVATLTLRFLLDSQFGTSTLVYIAVPFVISLVLAFFTKRSENTAWRNRYFNHLRISTIIFLATSVILFEGFICVVMFMPIYYLFVSVGFFFASLNSPNDPNNKSLKNTFKAYGLPVVVLLMVSEGLVPATTIEREGRATFVADSPLSVFQLQTNMAKPINFDGERHWFLKLFPLPDHIAAGTLSEGDTHIMHFTYNRWIFANAHKGQMHVKISKVSPQHIRTEITRNDSYLANYMDIDGTDIHFIPQTDGSTRVALTVRYERRLDPAWYFGTMQHVAARRSAQFFLSEIIFRHPANEVNDGT